MELILTTAVAALLLGAAAVAALARRAGAAGLGLAGAAAALAALLAAAGAPLAGAAVLLAQGSLAVVLARDTGSVEGGRRLRIGVSAAALLGVVLIAALLWADPAPGADGSGAAGVQASAPPVALIAAAIAALAAGLGASAAWWAHDADTGETG